MSIKQTRLKKLSIARPESDIQVPFSYPFVILFEDNKNIRIVNVLDKDACLKNTYTLEKDVKSYILHDQMLWLAFDSSELIVIDVIKGLQLKLIINNYANYKIIRFVTDDKNLFLISESGERLAAPFSSEKLISKFDTGVTEEVVSLEKSFKSFKNFSKENTIFSNGLYMYPKDSNIGVKCPITGVTDFIYSENDVEYIVPWGDTTVLGNKTQLWILNIKEYDVIYEFENVGSHYYPLDTNNNVFYYLVWDNEEVHICCAVSSHCQDQQNFDSTIASAAPLSTQESLKLQLKSMVEEAIHAVKPQVEQFQTLFDSITDYTFLINMATKLCKHNLTYKSLLYQLQKKVFSTDDNSLMKLFSDVMIKIDLLEYIFFRGNNFYKTINLFDINFIELCVTFISKSDLDLASICWLKYSEMKLTITPDDIVNVLNAIPVNIKMGGLIIWLRNFIPPLLDINPFYIDLFVKWTTDRVLLLEQSSYWPKIGLKFIEDVAGVLEKSLKTISLRPISIDDLDVLKDHINYVMELREKHRINMLLSELSSQSPTEVALIMLRRCYTEDLERFLQESLPYYAARYQIELDDTLRSFIESEAASSGGSVDGHRLQILLNAFRTPNNKLECLLQVLKVLEVPWNDTVLKIATDAAASANTDFTVTDSDRAIAQEINMELNYAKIKVILKKYNFPITFTNYITVIHKIINTPTVDLHDLKVITTVVSAYSDYAHLLYIDKCLRDCDTSVALDYFKNLPYSNRKVLLLAVVNKYEQIINRKRKDPTTERNYLDLLKGIKCLDNKTIIEIENLYHLKNSYDITFSLNNICKEKVRNDEANNWERKVGTTASSGRGRCVNKLLRKSLSRDSNLLTLLRKISTSPEVRDFVERFVVSNQDNFSILLQFKDGGNSSILLEACKVLSQLIFSCVEEYLHYLIDRLAILNYFVNSNITMTNLSVIWKFHYMFLPMSSVPALNDLIDFYIKTESIDLFNISNKSDFIPIRIVGNVMSRSIKNNANLSDDFFKARSKICRKLLTKVVAAQDLDHILFTNVLLTLCDGEETNDNSWILDILRGQSDSLNPVVMHYLSSPLIRRTFDLYNLIPGSNMSYPPQYVLKNKFNINLADIALPENTEETWDVKILLFYILRHFPNTSFERLSDLCHTLNVSLNYGLSLLLISILSNWDLKYKINVDNLGCRQILLENDENQLLSTSLTVWESIQNKDFIKDILSDFWKNGEVTLHGCLVSINPYHYEVYLCIYHLIFNSTPELRNTKEYFLINFLKDYKRKSTPRQYEFELFSVKGMFPEIGHYRLPFHLFMRDDMWSNLKSEITLETYEYWLPVVPLLSLDSDLQTAKDMICSNAVKQTMTSRKRQDSTELDPKDREPWRLISREEPLLRTAHRCVKHIANMEWAGACLFYVLQGCARGADQVAAAQLCYQFSQRWASVQPGNRAVQQMARLHSSLSTRHALHKIDWACEELIRLSTEPAQLIQALYLHPQFVDKVTRHDVNRAANEIADKNNVNISSIRIQILESILDKTSKENKHSVGLETKDLITAKYILKATCPKMGAIYLSRIAFDDDSDFNKCKKLRALQCLMSVIEPETAVKVTNREREALWISLLDLLFIVNLEKIDMPWIVATFLQDKILAINQLIQVNNINVEGLKVAAKLAHMYGNVKVIRELIPRLLRTALYEEMIPLLLQLLYPIDNVICTAWRAIILTPFQRADYPITERQKAKCLSALNLLPVCPVINDDDLIEIWKNCVRCKCYGLGCLVLPYITAQRRQTLSELHKIDRRNLIISLKNLQADTYLTSGAMYVIENMSQKNYR
ncbi:uncharacterized protein rod [Epargyreus clarus]|uniref:uncharacterized protein rod n=1 Tax=Epargyreus clarus TaxID=520877 RepID=UPI003C2FF979